MQKNPCLNSSLKGALERLGSRCEDIIKVDIRLYCVSISSGWYWLSILAIDFFRLCYGSGTKSQQCHISLILVLFERSFIIFVQRRYSAIKSCAVSFSLDQKYNLKITFCSQLQKKNLTNINGNFNQDLEILQFAQISSVSLSSRPQISPSSYVCQQTLRTVIVMLTSCCIILYIQLTIHFLQIISTTLKRCTLRSVKP